MNVYTAVGIVYLPLISMLDNAPYYLIYIFAFACSELLSISSIPRIIYVAKRKRLFDVPDNDRKAHQFIVPNLGGIGIFFSFVITSSLFINPAQFYKWNYMVAAALILFIVGIKDDLISIPPYKKFLAQFFAAMLIVYFADVRLTSLYGILGVNHLPDWISISFSTIGIVFVTNAYNLIDGIDGLAGSIGALCAVTLGTLLAFQGETSAAAIAYCLGGAIVGFLRFNISPAKIFMGDTGSLLIGFMLSLLCILFVNSFNSIKANNTIIASVVHSDRGAIVIVLAILFIPVFDSFRVFTTRAMKGRSPFSADRTHLHHFLLDVGFSHTRTVMIIAVANALIIAIALLVQDYNPNIAIAIILAVAFILLGLLHYIRKHRMLHDEKFLKRGK
jgi:UDP-N-acetylmuramyl pentapeptide phosphotransferase/UDP-N-acetylglucosamine-1-phosphate transferase